MIPKIGFKSTKKDYFESQSLIDVLRKNYLSNAAIWKKLASDNFFFIKVTKFGSSNSIFTICLDSVKKKNYKIVKII